LAAEFQATTPSNPSGQWDAIAIWNLRAKFLSADGDLWRRAISAEPGSFMLSSSHPAYPLFLSAWVAIESSATQWAAERSFDDSVPAMTSIAILLALVALLVASLAARG